MNNAALLSQLPQECRTLTIEPRHKVALDHFLMTDGTVWVVLLTTMPGDSPKAWHMTKREYWSLQPKHGTRDRYIRENFTPTIVGTANPPKRLRPLQLCLLF